MHGSEKVDLISREDGDMVFVDVVVDDHGPDMPGERPDRGRFERLAAAHLSEHPDGDGLQVRCDIGAQSGRPCRSFRCPWPSRAERVSARGQSPRPCG